MEKTMSRRSKIRLYAFGAAVLAVLLTYAISGSVRAARMERQVRLSSERALCELDTYLSNIHTDLKKGAYANTPTMLGSMATGLLRESTGAKSSLSVLPLTDVRLNNIYKFLSQIGDFVNALDKKVEAGETISDKEREQLFSLLKFSQTLSEDVSNMRQQLFDGYLSFDNAESTLADDGQTASLTSDMESAEQSLTEYPSLIYDGPFSDHINQMESELLKNAAEVTKEQAREKAAKFLGLPLDKVSFLYEENDATAAYCFAGGDDQSIAVTKRGGYLLYMLSSRFAGEAKLQYEDARRYASEFLEKNGFNDMTESYYTISDGVCTINFAYQDGVYICYPDLIKVSVSLEDGAILSADCRGYMMNHKARSAPANMLTTVEAQKNVSPLLTVMDTQPAVIPTESKGEKFTYEFHCKNKDGEELLVYIDVQTGLEDDILLLLYSDDGVLTK